jgi:hypothetical protein
MEESLPDFVANVFEASLTATQGMSGRKLTGLADYRQPVPVPWTNRRVPPSLPEMTGRDRHSI